MKNSAFVFILTLATIFLNVSAQERAFTEKELETIKLTADKKLKEISHRLVKFKKFKKTKENSIYEFVSPNREHYIIKFNAPAYQLELPEFGAITKDVLDAFKRPAVNSYDEWIYIGEKIYHRDGVGEKWEQIYKEYEDKESNCMCLEMPHIRTEYKFTPKQFVNKQKSDLYEVLKIYQYSFKTSPSIYRYKYWFNKKGLPAKIQYSNDLNSDEMIMDYEYDLNIKIEIPLSTNMLPKLNQ